MQRQLMTLVWAALAGLATGPAQADVSAQVSLTNFGYSLIDLNADDDIAPGILIQNQAYIFNGSVGESVVTPFTNDIKTIGFGSGGSFLDGSTVLRQVRAPKSSSAVARLSGSVMDHSLSILINGQATNSRADKDFASLFSVSAGPVVSLAMTLTPFTKVVWTGDLLLSAEQTLGRRLARVEEGRSSAEFSIIHAGTGELADILSTTLLLDRGVVMRRSDRLDLSLSFSNLSNESSTAFLRSYMSGDGKSFLPVPEPGTSAMMLCGMGLLVTVHLARRRSEGASRRSQKPVANG